MSTAAVGNGQGGGAHLCVPRHGPVLGGRADPQRVDTVRVAVAVAVVLVLPPIPAGPDKNGT